MKFRIVEYAESQNTKGHRFFVQVGQSVKLKVWWIFFRNHTEWVGVKDTTNPQEDAGHETMSEAMAMVQELKRHLPKYHNLK